jgi:hypothetical protein
VFRRVCLSEKDPVECIFFTSSKIVEAWNSNTGILSSEIFSYVVYRISFSCKYCVEKSTVQVCVSPSVFMKLL